MANIQVAGRVARDGQLHFTASNVAVLSFSVAENYYNGGKKEVQFFNCKMFGDRAEKVAQHICKGGFITIFGTFRMYEYSDRNTGQTRTGNEIVVNDVILQGGSLNEQQEQTQQAQQPTGKQDEPATPQAPQQKAAGKPAAPIVDDIDDDIPF